jgi:hypothetical protein
MAGSFKPPAKCWCGWPRNNSCHALHPGLNPQPDVESYHCWLQEHHGPKKVYIEVSEIAKLITRS